MIESARCMQRNGAPDRAALHVEPVLADFEFLLDQFVVEAPLDEHVIALEYLLAAVEITSLLRRRISKRVWRVTHFASFAVFAFSTVHLLTAGTDRTEPALRIAVWATVAAATALTALRVRQATSGGSGRTASISKPRINLGDAR